MKRIICTLISVACSINIIGTVINVNTASAYSQDPRSCNDPRGQYPGNPPC